jgi:sugar/nucleoside kinase (ribokinase family)
VTTPIPTPPQDNGCCYCFVEADGERTFLSHHWAEYRFFPEWFQALDAETIGSAYVCGLELEESTGEVIVDFLAAHPAIRVFFAPGPRLLQIPRQRLERMLSLHPVLHLSRGEAPQLAGLVCPGQDSSTAEAAAAALSACTGNPVLVTLGGDGCLWAGADGSGGHVPGVSAPVVDTIGAGDAHIGTVMGMFCRGASLGEALTVANRIAAAVVSVPGALLSDGEFAAALSRSQALAPSDLSGSSCS